MAQSAQIKGVVLDEETYVEGIVLDKENDLGCSKDFDDEDLR